jgi:hypothetical protein
MKAWGILGVVCATWAGCGGDGSPPVGGGGELPDGHIQAGCQVDTDCDDGNKCHVNQCLGQVCNVAPKPCPAPDACNVGMCDPADGTCGTISANEGGACTTAQSLAGFCLSGFCQPLPTCYDPNNNFNSLTCGSTPTDDSTDPINSFATPTMALDTYACATLETGPEVAYSFAPPVDGDVTISLTAKEPAGVDLGPVDLAVASPDLDLIILDGGCNSKAACMNPMLPGGGYAGITAGTGNEKVTFHAQLGHTYYVVIDGKNGAMGDYHLSVDSCGACNATTAATIACNQSMPLAGNTAKGQSKLSAYSCANGTMTQMVNLPGNEQTFHFTTSAPVNVTATAKVTGASSPVSLLALPSTSGACDPTMCAGSTTTTNGAASLSFSAMPDFNNNIDYWVVIDTPSTTDATYGLALSCAPYCSNYFGDSVDCTTKSVSGSNDQYGSTNDVSAWGPSTGACGGMTNLSGPEYVYLFHKTPTTNLPKYRFTLAATTAKHLGLVILDAGTTNPASCNPTITCGSTAPVTVAASGTTLASTGTYVSAGPGTTDGGTAGKTAVVDLTTGTLLDHYYWVIVDGVTGDASSYTLSIDSGCP